MNLIVGLGNPGTKYNKTLHNMGFMVVEKLAKEENSTWYNFSKISSISKINTNQTILLKPLTFMNESGRSVREIVDYFKINLDNLWVVHDELDLPPGEIRINFNSSAAGHRGVQNIIDTLSSQSFWRFRLGIGRPPTNLPAENYVLTEPPDDIKHQLSISLIKATSLLKIALEKGIKFVQKQK